MARVSVLGRIYRARMTRLVVALLAVTALAGSALAQPASANTIYYVGCETATLRQSPGGYVVATVHFNSRADRYEGIPSDNGWVLVYSYEAGRAGWILFSCLT